MARQWWKEAVAYQVYPRSFNDSNGDGIGDLRGLIEKLDYLQELGIDVIWLSPMFPSPNADNGYDISDYQAISETYGTMADFDELLEKVHARGMRLILDLVVNHTSDEHPWFIESKQSCHNPKRDWYIWRDPATDGSEPNNWESIFNGSTWKYDETTNQYYFHLFSEKQPDLNWENPAVRDEVFNMMNWWFDKGIDGFRVDAITHIKKSFEAGNLPVQEGQQYAPAFDVAMNQPGILTWLREMKAKSLSYYDIMTVGEANGVASLLIMSALIWLIGVNSAAWIILLCLTTFIIFFGVSWGPVLWVMLPELFPMRARGAATGIAALVLSIGSLLVAQFFPVLTDVLQVQQVFLIFAVIGIIAMIFVIKFLPETRGRSLEQIEQDLRARTNAKNVE
ncbi:MFS transporter [Staphylococcus pseudintermedius]|nr:MFS transporter [Staphylococcus pseudintermedius]